MLGAPGGFDWFAAGPEPPLAAGASAGLPPPAGPDGADGGFDCC